MSYQQFSDDIFLKTGTRLHLSTLQKYTNGQRNPSKSTLKVLSRYSGQPISWFLEDDIYLRKPYNFEKAKEILEYKDVFLEAKRKNIPPKAIELFIQSVEATMKQDKA